MMWDSKRDRDLSHVMGLIACSYMSILSSSSEASEWSVSSKVSEVSKILEAD